MSVRLTGSLSWPPSIDLPIQRSTSVVSSCVTLVSAIGHCYRPGLPRVNGGLGRTMPVMNLVGYGTYVPSARLNRAAIASTLGTPAGKGTRAVASYDEDTTSMGVEAARVAVRSSEVVPTQVLFSTALPAYLDRTN